MCRGQYGRAPDLCVFRLFGSCGKTPLTWSSVVGYRWALPGSEKAFPGVLQRNTSGLFMM